MGKPRQNQTPAQNQSDVLAMEDQTLNSNKAATTISLPIGERKTVGLWITGIYNQKATKVKSNSGKGK